MKTLFKLLLLALVVAAVIPFVRPDSPVSAVIGAAVEDASGFCERQPSACAAGAAIAYRTTDIVAAALQKLADDPSASPLTGEDRALLPADAALTQQPLLATHGAPEQE